jgi:hypothetical protein
LDPGLIEGNLGLKYPNLSHIQREHEYSSIIPRDHHQASGLHKLDQKLYRFRARRKASGETLGSELESGPYLYSGLGQANVGYCQFC